MKSTKKAFTLVELIVVITILAILGTIAFISLQGYSADARNSKRISDLGNIQSAVTLKAVEGVPIMSFVDGTTNSLASIALAGKSAADTATANTNDSKYAAGIPNYAVLNVVAKDFKDPTADAHYKIGATDMGGDRFQVAATMESDGADQVKVNGTYRDRDGTTHVSTVDTSGKTITVASTGANWFKPGDAVKDGATGTANVTRVSRDGMTITVDAKLTAGTIALANAETTGLISNGAATPAPVVNTY